MAFNVIGQKCVQIKVSYRLHYDWLQKYVSSIGH